MSSPTSLSSALRAVAERVDQGEPFPVALRHVANELEALEAALPDWHVAAIDDALGDSNEEAVSWDAALSQLRDEVAGA